MASPTKEETLSFTSKATKKWDLKEIHEYTGAYYSYAVRQLASIYVPYALAVFGAEGHEKARKYIERCVMLAMLKEGLPGLEDFVEDIGKVHAVYNPSWQDRFDELLEAIRTRTEYGKDGKNIEDVATSLLMRNLMTTIGRVKLCISFPGAREEFASIPELAGGFGLMSCACCVMDENSDPEDGKRINDALVNMNAVFSHLQKIAEELAVLHAAVYAETIALGESAKRLQIQKQQKQKTEREAASTIESSKNTPDAPDLPDLPDLPKLPTKLPKLSKLSRLPKVSTDSRSWCSPPTLLMTAKHKANRERDVLYTMEKLRSKNGAAEFQRLQRQIQKDLGLGTEGVTENIAKHWVTNIELTKKEASQLSRMMGKLSGDFESSTTERVLETTKAANTDRMKRKLTDEINSADFCMAKRHVMSFEKV